MIRFFKQPNLIPDEVDTYAKMINLAIILSICLFESFVNMTIHKNNATVRRKKGLWFDTIVIPSVVSGLVLSKHTHSFYANELHCGYWLEEPQ